MSRLSPEQPAIRRARSGQSRNLHLLSRAGGQLPAASSQLLPTIHSTSASPISPRHALEWKQMATRTFSLQDAQMLLPTLESLLRSAITSKKLIEEVDAELQELAQRIFVNGGTLVNVDAVAEIHATGVQVKDIDIGLLDFPCRLDGEIVLLCWKLGEPTISHWHSTEEGFAGRKPIDERFERAGKKKKF